MAFLLHFLAALLSCSWLSSGHICMWEPIQRGNFSIDTPGSPPCYQKEGPCGVNGINGVRTTLQAASTFEVKWQQNLNHFYTGRPGYMDITFAVGSQPVEEDFNVSLGEINDYNSMNEVTQTNFSINITVPDIICNECVLRVRYQSNNPYEDDRGTIFYQCADIKIENRQDPYSNNIIDDNNNDDTFDEIVNDNSFDCCAPDQWITQFTHLIPNINYESNGVIWYDNIIKAMRYDVTIGDGTGQNIYNGMFSMILNFTNGLEYYYNINANTCSLYGLDLWNEWCYGNTYNQSEILLSNSNQCINNKNNVNTCTQWQNDNFIFETYNDMANDISCLPSSLSRKNGEKWLYHDIQIGAFNPNVFIPNSQCQFNAQKVPGC